MTTLVLSRELLLDTDLCAVSWCLCSKVNACLGFGIFTTTAKSRSIVEVIADI